MNNNCEMSHGATDDRIRKYIEKLNNRELHNALEYLELDTAGESFIKATRLYRRLLGDYSIDDFSITLLEEEEEEIRHRRNTKCEHFIHNTILQNSSQRTTPNSPEIPMAHSSTTILDSDVREQHIHNEIVVPVVTSTTANTYSVITSMATHTQSQVVYTTSQGETEPNYRWHLFPDGARHYIHKDISTQWYKQQAAINKLESLLYTTIENFEREREEQNRRTSATNVRTVQFQDTFNPIDNNQGQQYLDNQQINVTRNNIFHSTTLPATCTAETRVPITHITQPRQDVLPSIAVPRGTACAPAPAGTGWRGGSSSQPTEPRLTAGRRSPQWLPRQADAVPPAEAPVYRSAPSSRNIAKSVREWKLKFSGKDGLGIESFLEQVEEYKAAENIADHDMLNAMSLLLKEPAIYWYRQCRPSWQTYRDFEDAALKRYSKIYRNPRGLSVEAHLRTQGTDEPVADYIIALSTIMSRFEIPWSIEEQINLLINNMLPSLKHKVEKHKYEFFSIQDLIERAQSTEDKVADSQWRPPPVPEACLLPEMAYKPPSKGPKPKASLAAVSEPTGPKEADLLKAIGRLLEEKLKHLNIGAAPQGGSSQPSNKPSYGNAAKGRPPVQNSSPFRYRENRRSSPRPERRMTRPRNTPMSVSVTPKSDKNKNQKVGPDPWLRCW